MFYEVNIFNFESIIYVCTYKNASPSYDQNCNLNMYVQNKNSSVHISVFIILTVTNIHMYII